MGSTNDHTKAKFIRQTPSDTVEGFQTKELSALSGGFGGPPQKNCEILNENFTVLAFF